VIIPEKEMATKVARSLITPNVLDYIPISGEYTICEMAPLRIFTERRSENSTSELSIISK